MTALNVPVSFRDLSFQVILILGYVLVVAVAVAVAAAADAGAALAAAVITTVLCCRADAAPTLVKAPPLDDADPA